MAAPASEELREIANELVIAAETGETRTFEQLREQFGVGHGDLEQMLGTLAEHGQASEVAPGEWSGPDADGVSPVVESREDPESGRVRVSIPDASADPDVDPGPVVARQVSVEHVPTVRLTMAIADALDAESIGKIVKAGIDDCRKNDLVFVMEIEP